jgi:hypothetical protein
MVRIARPQVFANKSMALQTSQPSFECPYGSDKEKLAFDFFQSVVVEDFKGHVHTSVWNSYIIPIAVSEPIVRQGALALGSLRGVNDRPDGYAWQQLALKHHSNAIRALHRKLQIGDAIPIETVLVACLLFLTFELQCRGWEAASTHLNAAREIIASFPLDTVDRSAASSSNLYDLIDIFTRLDMQISFFTSQRIKLGRAPDGTTTPILPADTILNGISQACRALEVQLTAMQELTYLIESRRFAATELSGKSVTHMHGQITHQLVSLNRWVQCMSALWPSLTTKEEQYAARTLQVQGLCCKIMVSNCLNDGQETSWDSYHDDFAQLLQSVEQATIIQEHATPVPASSVDSTPRMTIYMGVIPATYFTALKVRHPSLRRQAVALLRRCKRQEGPWNGSQNARLAEQVIMLEEEGLQNIKSASDVPESSRLYQAWYDLRSSEYIVYCKRRCFEGDGRWLEFTRDVRDVRAGERTEAVLPPESPASRRFGASCRESA